MSGRAPFPEPEAAAAREAVLEFLAKHGGNASRAARELGVNPANIIRVKNLGQTPSIRTVEKLARLSGKSLDEILKRPVGVAERIGSSTTTEMATMGAPPGRYPKLEKCIAAYEDQHRWTPATIEAVRAGLYGPDDMEHALDWVERLDAAEKALRRLVTDVLGGRGKRQEGRP